MPHPSITWCASIIAALAMAVLTSAGRTPAQTVESELKALRKEIEELRRRETEKQRRLEELERRIEQLQAQPPVAPPPRAPHAGAAPPPAPPATAQSALGRAIDALGAQRDTQSGDWWSRQVGGTRVRLIDIGLDVLAAAGTSTATDDEIRGLHGGAHDPQRRGFTLQQTELSVSGAVDPYLAGEAHIIFVPDGVEHEEAFLYTTALPAGLQLEAGHFFTEFGIINPLHPHAWDWIDQPVINNRLFGGDGLRAPGFRLGWLSPLPWYSHVDVGAQNAGQGETTISFIGEEGIGGRPALSRAVHDLGDLLYLTRWENFVDLADTVGVKLGVSGLHGPNSSGGDGETWIYGADLKVRWRPEDNFRGWPFLIWQTEAMKRDYIASSFPGAAGDEPLDPIARAVLRDAGFYSQLLYGFRYGWAAGTRVEYASGSKPSLEGGRQADPFRDDRYRVSPLLVWQPSEFSRFRLQYNYDNARHLPERDAHSVWVGGEVLYGAHAAHKY
jgi:hypothetical protein